MRRIAACLLVVAGLSLAGAAQTAKPVIAVAQCSAQEGLAWRYSFAKLQQTIVETLQKKLEARADIRAALPGAPVVAGAYTLNCQVIRMADDNDIDNHAGGVASNTQMITVRYWLLAPGGQSVFDKKSTYSALSTGVANYVQADTAGPIAKDLAADIADRVKNAKIYGR